MGAVFDHKAWAAKSGPVYGDLAAGDITQLNVNGAATDFIVVHQGNPDSTTYDDSCNGTWLLMKDIYENRQWHSSETNDYANSTIHSYLNSTFLALFDAAVQSAIKQVKIPYVNGTGSGGSVASGSNGLSAKIFLLSGPEVHFTHTNMDAGEGAALSYFASCATTSADSTRVADLNGSASTWWLRSPKNNSVSSAWLVLSDGGRTNNFCSNSRGVRPCLVMPAGQRILS